MRLSHIKTSLLLAVASGIVLAQNDPAAEIETLTLQWTSIERQRNLLESNWRDEQPVLEQQLDLLERERNELTAFLEQTAADQDDVETRRLELLDRQSELEQQQASLERELDAVVVQVKSLHAQLPPPLVASWNTRMPELDAEFLSTSERLQVLLELLGELDDFERRLSLNEEVMTLPDGQEHVVRQVYLGVAQGWYVSANGLYAGVGHPGANGWQWQASDEPETIDRLIAILERRRGAEFLSVPIQLVDLSRP